MPSLDSRKVRISGNRASALPEPASGANALTTGVPLGSVDRNTEKWSTANGTRYIATGFGSFQVLVVHPPDSTDFPSLPPPTATQEDGTVAVSVNGALFTGVLLEGYQFSAPSGSPPFA